MERTAIRLFSKGNRIGLDPKDHGKRLRRQQEVFFNFLTYSEKKEE